MIHLDIDVHHHDALARHEGGILGWLFRLLGNRPPVAEALEKKFARRLRRKLRNEIRENGLRQAVKLRLNVAVPRPAPPPAAAPKPVPPVPVRSTWLPRHPLSAFARTPAGPISSSAPSAARAPRPVATAAARPSPSATATAAPPDGRARTPAEPDALVVPRSGYGFAIGIAPVLGFVAGLVLAGMGVDRDQSRDEIYR